MGNSIILTKSDPSELSTIEKAEAFQISLLGDTAGEQRIKEEHCWWNERDQKAEVLLTTYEPETLLPLEEARRVYKEQIAKRSLEGFVHSRSFCFRENKFVYRDLRELPGFEAATGER